MLRDELGVRNACPVVQQTPELTAPAGVPKMGSRSETKASYEGLARGLRTPRRAPLPALDSTYFILGMSLRKGNG